MFVAQVLVLAQAMILSAGVLAQTCTEPPFPPTPARPVARLYEPQFIENVRRALASNSYPAIAFGDSIMVGWQREQLDEAMGRPTLNVGFAGDTTESILWRLQMLDWHNQTPDYVLLLVGKNDVDHAEYSDCDIFWGMVAVVKKVRETFPSTCVIVTSVLPHGSNLRAADSKTRSVNNFIREGTDSGTYAFLDVHDAFLCNHRTPCPLYQSDNLHLTRSGYLVLSQLLKKRLAELHPIRAARCRFPSTPS
jgi:lysophospholipase L1-like esterase